MSDQYNKDERLEPADSAAQLSHKLESKLQSSLNRSVQPAKHEASTPKSKVKRISWIESKMSVEQIAAQILECNNATEFSWLRCDNENQCTKEQLVQFAKRFGIRRVTDERAVEPSLGESVGESTSMREMASVPYLNLQNITTLLFTMLRYDYECCVIPTMFPNLVRLELTFNLHSLDEKHVWLLIHALPYLESLSLSVFSLSNAGLKTVDISDIRFFALDMDRFENIQEFKKSSFVESVEISADFIDAATVVQMLDVMPTVKHLNLISDEVGDKQYLEKALKDSEKKVVWTDRQAPKVVA